MGYYVILKKIAFVALIKAFDKAWRRVLLFKLEQNGTCGELLKLSKKYGIVGYYLSLNKMPFVVFIKAFGKAWHRVLLSKLEQNGICGTN